MIEDGPQDIILLWNEEIAAVEARLGVCWQDCFNGILRRQTLYFGMKNMSIVALDQSLDNTPEGLGGGLQANLSKQSRFIVCRTQLLKPDSRR